MHAFFITIAALIMGILTLFTGNHALHYSGTATSSNLGSITATPATPLTEVYTSKGTILEKIDTSTLPQAGTEIADIDTLQPKVTLKKWGGEVAMGVRLQNMIAIGLQKPSTSEVDWQQGNQTMSVTPVSAAPMMEDGGYAIDVTLASIPATNVFNFVIDGTENLDFFYQAPLWQEANLKAPTPECTDTDCTIAGDLMHRPINVVGSYAVYYKNHRDHIQGQMNYATGKAYHIFRPQVIDVKGVTVWADLAYANGVLSVTVPQSFLDSATYPVVIDPTFGYSTQGGTSGGIGGARSYIGAPYTATTGDVITGYSIYGCNSTGNNIGIESYTYNGTGLVNQLGGPQTISGLPSCGLPALTSVNGLSESLVGGTQYAIAMGDPNGATFNISFDTTSGNQNDRQTSFTLAATWTHLDYTATKFSMYATYVAANSVSFNVLVIGGGGGGGSEGAFGGSGGGGGAGGYQASSTYRMGPGTYAVTVGAGGAGDTGSSGGAHGATSTLSDINSDGGGGGGGNTGQNGGSGSGANDSTGAAGSGISGQGNNGGTGNRTTGFVGGAGGGATAVGGNGSGTTGGTGGAGTSNLISGSSVCYAGGGGGGGNITGGTATCGGGAAGAAGTAGTAGTANTGGGGGAGSNNGSFGQTNGGNGGSGVVIIAWPTATAITVTCGGALTTSGANSICTFTSSANFTFSNNSTAVPAKNYIIGAKGYIKAKGYVK